PRSRRRPTRRASPCSAAAVHSEPGSTEERVVPTPMFPLGSVLYPYATLPLHVFEPRYRMMMRDCLRGDAEFGVVLIERGHEVGGGDARFSLGTLARLVRAHELPDGRYMVHAVGTRRLRVDEWLPDDPYPRAEVTLLPEPRLSSEEAERAGAALGRVEA